MHPPHVLYHAGCPDGFGSAWAIHRSHPAPATVYTPVQDRSQPPLIPHGSAIYILDTAFDRHQMNDLHHQHGAQQVTLIDHHETARDQLADLPGCHFDTQQSAAVMTWLHFNPGQPVPELLLYVQDRDLWRNEMPDTRAISAYLNTQRRDFQAWDRIHNAIRRRNTSFRTMIEAGDAILKSQRHAVNATAARSFTINIAGHDVPAVNTNLHRTEVAFELLRRNPDAPFAAVYRDIGPNERRWSLRSLKDGGTDVGTLAKTLGGGGHRHSAAFTQSIPAPAVPPAP